MGVSGQPLEIVASLTTECDTPEASVDPVWIYIQMHADVCDVWTYRRVKTHLCLCVHLILCFDHIESLPLFHTFNIIHRQTEESFSRFSYINALEWATLEYKDCDLCSCFEMMGWCVNS